MKQAIILFTISMLALTSLADDHTNVCTEAANPASYEVCMASQTSCAETIAACAGFDLCLSSVATAFALVDALTDFSTVTDCDCMEFTCDEDFTIGETDGNMSSSFVMTAGLMAFMKLFV